MPYAGFGGEPYTFHPLDPLDGAQDPRDLTRPLYRASFGEGARRFFLKYASFTGRASPREFWWGVLVYLAIRLSPVLPAMIMVLIGTGTAPSSPAASPTHTLLGILSMLFVILLFASNLGLVVPILALTWRRLQDANLPGAWALLIFVPLLGQLALLILVLMPSVPMGRRFDRRYWMPPHTPIMTR